MAKETNGSNKRKNVVNQGKYNWHSRRQVEEVYKVCQKNKNVKRD